MNKEINYKLIANRLWDILDDIDTSFDHYKPNMNDRFVNYVNSKVRERGDYANSIDGQTLVFNSDIPVLENDDPMVKWFKDKSMIESQNQTTDYAKMYGDKSNKFITEEHKDNVLLDNLYDALYRLTNATHAAKSFIKTTNDGIQAATHAINADAVELETSIGLNGPAPGQIPTGNIDKTRLL